MSNSIKILRSIVCIVAFLFTIGADAGDTWTGGAGTSELDNPQNWGGAMPGGSDNALLTTALTSPFILQGDAVTFYRLSFRVANAIDLGSESKTITATDRLYLDGPATMMLKSGTLQLHQTNAEDGRFLIGDWSAGNKFIVDGEGSTLLGSHKNGGQIVVGQNYSANDLIVQNGGHLEGTLSVGHYFTNNKPFTPALTNRVIVTGAKSSCVLWDNVRSVIGFLRPFNLLQVTDGATLTAQGSVEVGCCGNNPQEGYKSSTHNTVRVDGNGKMTVKNLTIGQSGSTNALVVVDGGQVTVSEQLVLGNTRDSHDSTFLGKPIVDNAALVSGRQTRFAADQLVVGCSFACGNGFSVEDGATVRVGTSLTVGNGGGIESSARDNLFSVSEDAALDLTGATALSIGSEAGSSGNAIKIAGEMTLTNNPSSGLTWIVGNYGGSNLFELNGGSLVATNATFRLGAQEAGRGNAFEVKNGATLRLFADKARYSGNNPRFTIGHYGAVSRLLVDGSTVEMPMHYLQIGTFASASNNIATISGGSTVNVQRVIVGDSAKNCALVVSNATITVADCLDISYSTANGSKIVFAGTNSTIIADSEFRPRYNSVIEVQPTSEPMSGPLIRAAWISPNKDASNPGTPTIRFTKCPVSEVVVVETVKSDISDSVFNSIVFDIPPTARVVRRKKSISVKPRKGMCLIFR